MAGEVVVVAKTPTGPVFVGVYPSAKEVPLQAFAHMTITEENLDMDTKIRLGVKTFSGLVNLAMNEVVRVSVPLSPGRAWVGMRPRDKRVALVDLKNNRIFLWTTFPGADQIEVGEGSGFALRLGIVE